MRHAQGKFPSYPTDSVDYFGTDVLGLLIHVMAFTDTSVVGVRSVCYAL